MPQKFRDAKEKAIKKIDEGNIGHPLHYTAPKTKSPA